MKTFVVVGLGRFGTAVALELSALGHEVLAIDADDANVQRVADKVTHAVIADARDSAVLERLGVGSYDCAVVAVGSDVGTSALITLNLKEQGVGKVVCKASSHVHLRVLEKIGADRVFFPEHEMGVKVAQGLASSSVLNFIEFSGDYSIAEIDVPASWREKSIKELDVRNRFHVNLIAVRSGEDGALNVSPQAGYVLRPGDHVVALGRDEDVSRLGEVQ